jgi:hypothetical protein
MDARLLDVIVGLVSLLVLVVCIALLPMAMPASIAYILSIAVFIFFMAGSGYFINEKIT